MSAKTFLVFWFFIMLGVSLGFYFHSLFLARLKEQYSDLYVSLGEPGVFTKYPISTKLIIKDYSPNKQMTKYAKFMAEKEWEKLKDGNLEKYVAYRKYIEGALFVGAIATMFFVYAATP